MNKILTPSERWERGIKHHPESIELMKQLIELDWKYLNGYFDFTIGGDGDNGETLMYLFDMIIDEDT